MVLRKRLIVKLSCKKCADSTLVVFSFTVDENIIATVKMQNIFFYPLKMIIGLFYIAPHLVIALPTLR